MKASRAYRAALGVCVLTLFVSIRNVQADDVGTRPSIGATGGFILPRRGLLAGVEGVSAGLEGVGLGAEGGSIGLGGGRRQLQSQTCIGVSPRIGCGLQWGLPSCCDSNPNTASGYSCEPNSPFGSCPSGKYAACCTLF